MNQPNRVDTTVERIFTLDVLRGFALVGIALINVQSLVGGGMTENSTVNDLVSDFEAFFVQGRFFPIFAFLFGVAPGTAGAGRLGAIESATARRDQGV